MTARVHRPLKFILFNASDIGGSTLSSVNSWSQTHLKPYERFFFPNYHFYRTVRFPGRKGASVVAVDLPPLVSIEVTGFAYRSVIVKCYLQQSVSHQAKPRMVDITELLSSRRKSLLAGDLNAIIHFRVA
jgi:hypothetical protein